MEDAQGIEDNAMQKDRNTADSASSSLPAWHPFLSTLFETISDGLALIGRGGYIERLNPAAERLLGISSREVMGYRFWEGPWEILGEDGLPLPPEAHQALVERVRQGPVEQHIVGLRLPGGETVRWLSLSLAPILGEGEVPIGCIVVFRDITAQREAEMARTNALEAARQALRAAEEERGTLRERMRYYMGLLHATLEASADGILVRDLQGHPVLYNRRFVEMFGRRPMALRPEDLKNPDHPFFAVYADPHEAAEQMRYMFENPSVIHRDILRLKDGRLIERTVRPQRLRGEVIGQVATYHDITEQRRLEAALRERTAYLYGVIDASPMCIFVKDCEGRYQLANRALANLFGLDVREFAGHTDAELGTRIGLDPANVAVFQENDRRVLESGEQQTFFEAVTLPGRETRWFEVIKVPLRENSHIVGILGVAVDRTEERHMAAALAEREARYRQLVEQAPLGIATLNAKGEVVEINRQMLEILGLASADPILGYNLAGSFAHPETLRHDIAQALAEGVSAVGEEMVYMTWRDKQGYLRYHVAPVRDGAGHITGAQLIIEDVTERRELEERLRQAAKLQAVGQLAAGVAHNYNNLLTVINGFAELALSGLRPGDPLRQDLMQIHEAGQRAAQLTRDLLAFSQRQVMEIADFDLNGVVESLLEMLTNILREGCTLNFEPAAEPLIIHADRSQVEQALVTLILNARDAMPQGGTVTIRTRRVEIGPDFSSRYLRAAPGEYALLEVADTGVGMPPEIQEHLFEPFFTTKPVDRATGMGLASVYGAMQQLGGGIQVESQPGQGSTFRLYFPLALREPAPSSSRRGGLEALPHGHERILLVEDQPELRRMLTTLLRRLGYQVLSAGSAQEALSLCDSQVVPFDMALFDVVLPDISGPVLFEMLPDKFRGIPVLYISGYADEAETKGIQGRLLAKPFTIERLAQAIRQTLSQTA